MNNVKITTSKDVFVNMKTFGNPKTQLFLSRLGLGDPNYKNSNNTEN